MARFQNKYYKLAAFSCAQNKTKRVLILVNRKLNLTIEHLGSDEKGRFVFIRCKIYNNRLALASIYGPNETDSAFLTQISKILLEEIDCPLVVGGDFNDVINPALDKSQSDTTATNPVAINDIFKGFYTNLYKAKTDFDEPICKQYLDKLELPRISQMDKESLEAPLSLEELHVSLKSLQKGKSPGLDGLPLNYT